MNRIKQQLDIIQNEKTIKDITIVHISDVHFNKRTTSKKLERIKNSILKIKPDYIMITGDLIDEPSITKDKYQIKKLLLFLTDLGNLTKVLISLGNHDVFNDNDYKFFDKLNDLKNIYILNNDCYKDEFIYVSGFTLPTNYYYNMTHDESTDILLEHLNKNRKLLHKISSDIPRVALIHSPVKLINNDVLTKLKEYDLILSGHTHNGMVPTFLDKIFPKNKGIIAPNKKLLPEYARGKIENQINGKKITTIISGGVTKLSIKSSKLLSKLNFIYDISINKIIITKKRGRYYE